jgi:peptidyl-prolyl cis-trans isomerase B (cyclophilin B)
VMLSNNLGNTRTTVLARINDDALLSLARGEDPAVGAPGTCRESDDEHSRRLPGVLVHSDFVTDRNRDQRLARARDERRAQRARKRQARRRLVAIGSIVAVLLLLVAGFLISRSGQSDETALPDGTASPDTTGASPAPAPESTCAPAQQPRTDDIQFPDWDRSADDGVVSLDIETNCGLLTIGLDSRAPETTSSMAFLSREGYFNGVRCHRVTTAGIFVVQCGDPAGNGTGGPGYSLPDENLPPINDKGVAVYPRGTVAMANAGPGTGGSQFFIVYRDSPLPPNYTVWGQVSRGIDIVDYVADGGVVDGGPDGQLARPLQFTAVTLRS